MGTPLGHKYVPYTYMDPLGTLGVQVGLTSSTLRASNPKPEALKRFRV